MKSLIKKFLYGNKYSSESYIKYLRKIGMDIGEGTVIYDPRNVTIDETRPFLITIGKHVSITKGVTILTHGYDWSVLKGVYGKVLGSAEKVTIGNNVFIGMHTTILKGVTIEDNVIIGANTLVNKNLQSGYVYAGNPVKQICDIESYFEKRNAVQLKEALEVYKGYVDRLGKEPDEKIFSEFFFLFHDRNMPLPPYFDIEMTRQGNYKESLNRFLKEQPQFPNFNKFIEWCREQK